MAHALALIDEHHLGPDGAEGPEVEPLRVIYQRPPRPASSHKLRDPHPFTSLPGTRCAMGTPKDLRAAQGDYLYSDI